MNLEDLHEKCRCYRVECWEPSLDGAKGKWGRHHQIGVVCYSAREAMVIVEKKHPHYRIDAVNQVATVHYVLGTDMAGGQCR